MTEQRLITLLKSPSATLVVLVLGLIAQTQHAADVFRLIVHGEGVYAILHSYSFSIALELAVLLFVVQSRHLESYGFAAVSIAMNLSYYYLHGVHLLAIAAMPAWLVSVALPVAIARYSHAIEDARAQPAQPLQAAVLHAATPVQAQIVQEDAAIVQSATGVQDRLAQLRLEQLDNRTIARLLQSEFAISKAEIARSLQCNASSVSRWLNGHAKVQS